MFSAHGRFRAYLGTRFWRAVAGQGSGFLRFAAAG